MRAFIIRPFGVKQGIDFDGVESKLIDPALTAVGIAGRTTGEILQAGNIRTDMFQQLLVADLVVADISTNNANAFYELGIRHALRDCHTYLIRSRNTEPGADPAAQRKNENVPFDLLTDRYLAYDPDHPESALDTLIQGLRSTIAGGRTDSPVFLALPGLEAQEPSRFTPIPQDFGEELDLAAKERRRERLALLAMEARGLSWETAGLRAVGRKQFAFRYFADAKSTWEAVRENDPNDYEANLLLGTVYQRLGQLEKSNIALDRVAKDPSARVTDLAEAHALIGRNLKQLWQNDWKDAPPEERRQRALDSPRLLQSYEQYRKAYSQDLNSYFPGINALALLTIYLDLAGDDAEDEMKARVGPLSSAVSLSVEAAKTRNPDDVWTSITAADLTFLTNPKPSQTVKAYAAALADAPPFARESAARQLAIYRDLGVLTDRATAALRAVDAPAAGAQEAARLGRVILFTGHRIDGPDRATPRFPAACESSARAEILAWMRKVQEAGPQPLLGVAGAACGGDILFHEVCLELGIPTLVCLALPSDKYQAASVLPAWADRFYRTLANGKVSVLAEDGKMPNWLTDKRGYTIWQRNNLWELCTALAQDAARLTLLALWDGKAADGPGGTEDMVGIARERGAEVILINPLEICAKAGA